MTADHLSYNFAKMAQSADPLFGPTTDRIYGPINLMIPVPDMPVHLPGALESPLAWTGAQYPNPSEFVLTLSDDDIKEVEAALASFKGK